MSAIRPYKYRIALEASTDALEFIAMQMYIVRIESNPEPKLN